MKITYNSPVILTYTFLCAIVMSIEQFYVEGVTSLLFTNYPTMEVTDPLAYVRLASHVIGHANWNHLINNFTFILLLGPMLEEKYGSKNLLIMILITALVTGVLNMLFFSTGLLGASGVVFMLILLSSLTNFKSGHIPLTFILVVILFLGKEVFKAIQADEVSQFAHIAGGICGSIFGFVFAKPKTSFDFNSAF